MAESVESSKSFSGFGGMGGATVDVDGRGVSRGDVSRSSAGLGG